MTGRTILLLVVMVGTSAAQIDNGFRDTARRIRVRVLVANQAACDSSTRVTLSGNMGFAVAEGSVNRECIAEFFDVPAGKYRATVTGRDIANADAEIEVGPVMLQEVDIRALPTGGSDPLQSAASAFVSVSDLGVPSGAAKEFGKANHSIAKQDWTKAANELHKAVDSYPAYAAAYNNLGVVYSRTGNMPQAREALQKALSLNDHLAAAYVNLSRIDISEKDFPGAESLLSKASSLGPADVETLSLLAYAQLMDQHPDQAIETCHRGHTTQAGQHAFLHLVAARAYEQKNRIGDSVAELQLYLREEPSGPRKEAVRAAIATLQTQIKSNKAGGSS